MEIIQVFCSKHKVANVVSVGIKDFTAEKLYLPPVEFSLMIIDSTFLLLEKTFDVNIDYIVNFALIIKKDY